jgi:hypothetical protein
MPERIITIGIRITRIKGTIEIGIDYNNNGNRNTIKRTIPP